jgi:hypothetical protein
LQAAKDRFYPDELYIYFHYGPAVIGGSNNIAFLKDAQAMHPEDWAVHDLTHPCPNKNERARGGARCGALGEKNKTFVRTFVRGFKMFSKK